MIALAAAGAVASLASGAANDVSRDGVRLGTQRVPAVAQATQKPIIIGLAMAKTGFMALYDEAGYAAELRAAQINAQGGVLGRPLKLIWIDMKTDPVLSGTVARQLIGEGAQVIITSSDFDIGGPAALAANKAGILAIGAAQSPVFSDGKTLGSLTFGVGPGTDLKGSLVAEWAHKKKGWRSVYILQDQSLEYTKSLGRYFKARWQGLGGKIAGQDTWVASATPSVSAQVTRLRAKASRETIDFIFLPSYNPPAAVMIRAIRAAGLNQPIMCGAACDGTVLRDVAGPVSNIFFTPYICYAYCKGDNRPAVRQFVAQFKQRFGHTPPLGFTINGYEMITVVADAIRKAGTTDGKALAKAIPTLVRISGLSSDIVFPKGQCHKPRRTVPIVEVTKGQFHLVARYSPTEIPSIGDGNPCAGKLR